MKAIINGKTYEGDTIEIDGFHVIVDGEVVAHAVAPPPEQPKKAIDTLQSTVSEIN